MQIDAGDGTALAGVPVTTPYRTLLDLAASLGLVDLVVLGDSAIRFSHCTTDELARRANASSARGARALRRAVPLMDGRSESAWESVLRLLHVIAGMSAVQPQTDLTDADGRWVARGDLWLVGTRRVHEYDGATHRDPERHRADLAREKRLSRAGFERYGYTANEILRHPATVIRDAEDAFGLDHDPTRVLSWLAAMRESLFSRAGHARLRRAWRF